MGSKGEFGMKTFESCEVNRERMKKSMFLTLFFLISLKNKKSVLEHNEHDSKPENQQEVSRCFVVEVTN